jgi:hypothetical protein
VNANKMLIDARKAEHEGNDEKAKELYTAIINSFPDNNITKEAKLELNELLKTMRKKANKLLVLQLVGVVLFLFGVGLLFIFLLIRSIVPP